MTVAVVVMVMEVATELYPLELYTLLYSLKKLCNYYLFLHNYMSYLSCLAVFFIYFIFIFF